MPPFQLHPDCPRPDVDPPVYQEAERLARAEQRVEAVLRHVVRRRSDSRLRVREVAASHEEQGVPLVDVSLTIRGVHGLFPAEDLARWFRESAQAAESAAGANQTVSTDRS